MDQDKIKKGVQDIQSDLKMPSVRWTGGLQLNI